MIFILITGILFLALLIGGINFNLHILSRQIDGLTIDIMKIKEDVEEIKKATGENAFEAMLDKPIPDKYKWNCTEDLYKFHGGQVR